MRQPLHRACDAPPIARKRRERRRRAPLRKQTSEVAPSKTAAFRLTITPLRGFLIALLFLGIPTISLGTLCFSLLQKNLRLSQTNDELSEIASEVTAEVDSLGEEIDSLRERAGVPASSRSQLSRNLPQGGLENVADAFDLLKAAEKQIPELSEVLNSAVKPALEETLAEESARPSGQPVVGEAKVSSEFGVRSNPFGGSSYEVHEGMDFVGEQGSIIAATGDGKVTLAGPNGGYGISIMIDHGRGYETLYAHMSKKRVKVGDRIKQGQIIGYIGSTGRSSGPHLHYGLYKNDKAINPRTFLKLPGKAGIASIR